MDSTTTDDGWFTVRDIARQFGVSQDKILGWLRRGELVGVNLALNRTGRPRWRISRKSRDAFLESRQTLPTPKPKASPRRSAGDRDYIKFFRRGAG